MVWRHGPWVNVRKFASSAPTEHNSMEDALVVDVWADI